jgi:hypothetical protein
MNILELGEKSILRVIAVVGGLFGLISTGYVLHDRYLKPPPPAFSATFGVNNTTRLLVAPQSSTNDPDPRLFLIPAGLVLTNIGGEAAKNVSVSAYMNGAGINLHVANAKSHPFRGPAGNMTWQYVLNLGTVNAGEAVRKSEELYFSVEKDYYKRGLRGMEVVLKDGTRLRLAEEAIERYDWSIENQLELQITAENMPRQELRLPVRVGTAGSFRSSGLDFEHVRMRQSPPRIPPGPIAPASR